MILKIKNNGAFYQAYVTKGKNFYTFKLLRIDAIVEYYESYVFGGFTCSLQCRLKHYKNFKQDIFSNKYSPRLFKSIE